MITRKRSLPIAALILLTSLVTSPASALTQSEIQKLLASDGAGGDEFGRAVALDGDTAVIGTFAGDGNSADSGSAYVFKRDTNGVWTEQQKLSASDGAGGDRFGRSVDVDSDTIVIGAFFDVVNNVKTGSAYVFARGNGGVWTEQQKLTAGDGQDSDRFGHSVAIDKDTIAIAARSGDGNSGDSGSVYVFTSNQGVWSEQQELFASDGASGDRFGNSVDIDEDTVMAGAVEASDNGQDSGSAYVFTRDAGGVWSEQSELIASDGVTGDRFGHYVAMDGDTAVVAALFGDGLSADTGSVYLFTRSAGGVWTERQELAASDGQALDEFGHSIDVSGDTVVIGAYAGDGVSNDAGAAYVFTRNTAVWNEQLKLTASDGVTGDRFGWSVAMDGDTAIVAAKQSAGAGQRSGSAYVFSPTDKPVAELSAVADTGAGGADAAVTMRNRNSSSNEVHVFEGSDGNLVASMPFGSSSFTMRASTSVADMNSDGIAEISAVAVDDAGVVRAWALDTVAQTVLNTVPFPTLYQPIDLVSVTATNTGAERQALGLLGIDPDGASTLRFKDAASDSQVCDLIRFGKNFRSLGARGIARPAGNGIGKVAVLGVSPTKRVRVNVRDACDLADSVSLFFNKNFAPVDFAVVPDMDNNGFDEIAVLGRKTSGEVQVAIKDLNPASKALLGRYAFSANFVPIALVVIDTDQPVIGVLGRKADGTTRVTMKRAVTGEPAGTVNFKAAYLPRDIVVLDDSNGNDMPELAVLGFDASGQAHLEIKDSMSGQTLADRNVP